MYNNCPRCKLRELIYNTCNPHNKVIRYRAANRAISELGIEIRALSVKRRLCLSCLEELAGWSRRP